MSVTRTHVLKTLKSISPKSQLATEASTLIETLMNVNIIPRLINSSVKITSNRKGGQRKILKDDIECAAFAMFPFGVFANINTTKNANHILSKGLIKKQVAVILENDNQHNKLPTLSAEYIVGILEYFIKTILHNASVYAANSSKRISKELILESIAKNKDLIFVFPNEGLNFYKNKIEK
jgi:hypothetical protein